VRIVLDDQQDAVAGDDLAAVVGQLLGRPLGRRRILAALLDQCRGIRRDTDAGGRADIFQRQEEREGAALGGRAAQLDLAAQEICQLAADGEA
jgi:hypothetical protein